jgi:DNA polymerase III subunit delta
MSKPNVTFYVLHGNDSLRLEEEVHKLRAQMGDSPDAAMNISEFEGEMDSAAEILNAAMSYPFLADKRLVIVKDLLSWITRKGAGESGKQAVERLVNVLPQLPEWSKLVFVERDKLPEGNKILKLARELPTGYEKSFTAPKDSTQWILKRAADEYQVEIDPRAAQALASVTGDDLRRADNELAKLVDYVNGERPISEADVELLTPYVAEATTFQLVDAIAEGRGKAALDYLYRLIREKDEDPFKVYGMIIRQFRLMLLAKEHLALTGSRAGLKEALNTGSDFVADKTAQQSRRFSLTELEEIYRALQDYDLKMKTGRIDPPLALDMFIAGLSR